MSEFAERYYTLNQYYLDQGHDPLTASQLAVAKIQHEVRTSGHTYNCEFKVAQSIFHSRFEMLTLQPRRSWILLLYFMMLLISFLFVRVFSPQSILCNY